jgi:hypothetical protein
LSKAFAARQLIKMKVLAMQKKARLARKCFLR